MNLPDVDSFDNSQLGIADRVCGSAAMVLVSCCTIPILSRRRRAFSLAVYLSRSPRKRDYGDLTTREFQVIIELFNEQSLI